MHLLEEYPVRHIRTGPLDVAYFDVGPEEGDPVILLHGFPYDPHSFSAVTELLADDRRRIIVPYLRGHGQTMSLDAAGRSGEQAALGADVIELMDALGIGSAVLAGFDWGGRAACVAAALWPERCAGIVSVTGYLIQDIAAASKPLAPATEAGLWYFFYFATERGRAGLDIGRREIARVIWARNSPEWPFTDADLQQAAAAFDNPDYVEVVIHSYRHRLGLAPGHQRYVELERRLAAAPTIDVPAVTLDGGADGNFPATDGVGYSRHFVGEHRHHVIPGVGHNLPQENPEAFAAAIGEVEQLARAARR
ncbi:alpha/beta hydrolase [Herbiconiux sp. CPCC 205763]|uniref:Alpha/beta hydrolase n=1 Tax=Herbiconiux aconitum TaxID=2970913 RepID=A0ABT2GSA9_9MICO|nr:alpha/beta hydrolase [Herbiconiux aconitum]MCS5717799.1 alpha/beta hydrolase [Herbiconiux aconitum]